MAKAKKRKTKRKKKPGPKTERLKIGVDWVAAIRTSLRKRKPATGWPSPATE